MSPVNPPLVHRLSPLTISLPLLLLFVSTASLLFLSSDDNVSALWLQCSPTGISPFLPEISHLPLIGQLSCYMITFFDYAVASSRAFAVMSVILSFVAALLTIVLVESARIANQPSILIRSPTATLLFFNLAGGAVAWQVIIVPSFLYRSRRAENIKKVNAKPVEAKSIAEGESVPLQAKPDPKDPNRGSDRRNLDSWTEIYAIPLSIAIGYIIPSILWLYSPTPAIILIWLFFPLWISLFRRLIRSLLTFSPFQHPSTAHLESNTNSLLTMYALPVLLSIVSHAIIFNNLLQPDDGSPTTRAALGFIVIDFGMIGLTAYYWLLLEAGWKILGITLLLSMAAGPAAGMVVGWVLREEVVGIDTKCEKKEV